MKKRIVGFMLIWIIADSLIITLPLFAWTGEPTFQETSREAILRKAQQMVYFRWSPLNDFRNWMYRDASGVDKYQNFYSNQSYTGEAYTKREEYIGNPVQTWSEFYDTVNAITPAGQTVAHGNDCSGSVSISWGLSARYNTQSFACDAEDYGCTGKCSGMASCGRDFTHSLGAKGSIKATSPRLLLPGDALVKEPTNGHIILFESYSKDEKGIWVLEQTPYKAGYYFWEWKRLAEYIPIRRNKVHDFDYYYVGYWGGPGGSHGYFNTPQDVAINASGAVFVADALNNRIQVFDVIGFYLDSFPHASSPGGYLSYPNGIGMAPYGVVYVADTGHGNIQRFSSVTRNWIDTWFDQDEFDEVKDIAANAQGDVYVLESGKNRIWRRNNSGVWSSLGGPDPGAGDGTFDYPQGITAGPDSFVYVADTFNYRIQKFDRYMNFQKKWNVTVGGPVGIETDNWGHIYVGAFNTIIKYDGGGNAITSFTSNAPVGVAVNSSGDVYAVDSENHLVRKFSPSLPLVPPGPTELKDLLLPSGKIMLSWKRNSTNEKEFIIRRKVGLRGAYQEVGRPPHGANQFVDGTYIANTPYYYYVCAVNSANEESRYSNEIFSMSVKVKVTSPNGGEVIPSGTNYMITWEPVAPTSGFFKYAVEYSVNNGGKWNAIGTGVTSNWFHDWSVPAFAKNKGKCLVRITAFWSEFGGSDLGEYVASAKSDKPFKIEIVRVVSPNGGETYTQGTTQPISWQTNATVSPVAKVRLYYLKGGKKRITDPDLTGNPGSYSWQVPSYGKAWWGRIRVDLFDSKGKQIGSDISDGDFRVTVPGMSPLEFDSDMPIHDLVTAYFNGILGREPTSEELNAWVLEIERIQLLGIDIKEGFISLCKTLFNSGEYISRNRTDRQYVEDLYWAFFEEIPDSTVIDEWLDLLSQGWTREMILNGFILTEEFESDIKSIIEGSPPDPVKDTISSFYRGFLGRLPDTDGFNGWLNELQSVQCSGQQAINDLLVQMALEFVDSTEYTERNRSNVQYLGDLYDGILVTLPDVAEFDQWLGYLDDEMLTREQVVQLFLEFPGFQTRVQEIIKGAGLLCPGNPISPSGIVPDGTLTYTWNAVPTATSYRLWVEDPVENKIDQVYLASDLDCDNGTGTCSATPTIGLAEGTYSWRVQAGNGTDIGPWSNEMEFIIDTTPPTGTIAINSGATSTNIVDVTLTLSCNDNVQCSVMQLSSDGSIYSTPEPYEPSRAWTLTPNDGNKTVYVRFMDTAGNLSPAYNSTIRLDTTAPSTTASPAGGIYNSARLVTLSCGDGSGSGCDRIYYTTDGTTPTTSSPVYSSPINISVDTTLKHFGRDLAGNSEAVKTQIYTIDTVPPTGTITINSGAASTNTVNVTLAVSCSDAQGCSEMRFSNDGITYSQAEVFGTTKAWTLTTGGGTKTVYAKFKDGAGNWSGAASDTILLDTTAPTTTASPAGGLYNTAQSVALSCSDGSGSGCDKIYYTTNGTTPTTSSPVYASPVNISVNATLKYFGRDLAGNNESVKTQTYTIDTVLPTGTIGINSGAVYTNSVNVALTLSCGDAQGCSQMQFSNDGATYSTAETYGITKSWTLASGDGTKAVYVKFKDGAGNWSTAYSSTIRLDTTPPTGTITVNAGAASATAIVTLTLSCNDTQGCFEMQFSNDGVTYSAPEAYGTTKEWTLTSGDGSKTVYAKFRDMAGNWSAACSDTIQLDTTAPTGTITISSGAALSSADATLNLSCSDAYGCSQMQFSNDGVTYSAPEVYRTTKAWTLISGDGTKTVYAKFRDMAGNWSAVYSDTIQLDTTLPTGTITINSGTVFANSVNVTLNLSCNDAQGCSQMRFSNDGLTYSTGEAYGAQKAWTLNSGDGPVTVYAQFKDTAGNWSVTYSDTVLLDATAPSTTASPAGGTYSGTQSVTLTCGDGTGSGCDKIYYTTNGTTPTTQSPVYSSPVNISATTTLKFFAKDLAGNSEAVKTEIYTIQ